jgi:hypothetical protein
MHTKIIILTILLAKLFHQMTKSVIHSFFLPMESKRKGRWTCLTTFCVVSCKCFYFQRYTICAFIHGSKKLTGFQQFRFHFFLKNPLIVMSSWSCAWWFGSPRDVLLASSLLSRDQTPNPKHPKSYQMLAAQPNDGCCSHPAALAV